MASGIGEAAAEAEGAAAQTAMANWMCQAAADRLIDITRKNADCTYMFLPH